MIPTHGILPFTYQRLLDLLSSDLRIDEAVLFGSRALGQSCPGSDIDLALKGPQVTVNVALDLAGRLNEAEPLPYHFDVVSWNDVDSPDLQSHLEPVGQVIFRRNPQPLATT